MMKEDCRMNSPRDISKQRMLSPAVIMTLLLMAWTQVNALHCPEMFPSQPPPLTVNSVRPSDVAVFSSIGLNWHHSRELSTVVSRLFELMSLFNPALIRVPLDKTNHEFVQHRTLLQEASEVSHYLQNNQTINANKQRNLVLLFVHVDQLCVCNDQQIQSNLRATVEEVDDILQLLHYQLKHTIVSVALWDGELDAYQSRLCSCTEINSNAEMRLLKTLFTQILQESLEHRLAERRWYGDRDDFAVVLQDTPLVRDPVVLLNGNPPLESQQSLQTDRLLVQLWANLLQPASLQSNKEDSGATVLCPSEDRPFLRTQQLSSPHRHADASPVLYPRTGTDMPCEDLSPSNATPTTVHALRPGDINVVAAVGDSLTAGNGVGANPNNLLDVLRQYRGLSWSIGGDGNLTTVTSLPNILKHYNPLLTGYSVGMGKQDTAQAFLNQAVAGSKSKDMPKQVQALVTRMKNDSRIKFDSDWKVITMFIGGNDFCDSCYNSLYFSAENYVRHIREALDYLHEQVPRVLVNLVEPLQITPLRELHMDTSVKCPTWLVKILCPCVLLPNEDSKALEMVESLTRVYQRSLHELVETGRYDTREDFTVVVQPFLREIVVPKLPDGRPDRSYFSPDCFHLSQKAQTQMARSLWNNMLEPLGYKNGKHNFSTDITLKCPSKTEPYVRTYRNSNYSYSGPPPTPGQIPNWGSDFSCVDLAPSDSVPTSVHKLRPADIKVVAALGDSYTVGTGAKAKNLLELNIEYKGVSWSIGGDKTLETVTTLPNILKKFNNLLLGFSNIFSKGFNMAESGARTVDIPTQVKALIEAMKTNKNVNYEEDWKLVTIFIGGNDLCSYCTDQDNLSPKNYSHNLMVSLDMLYKEIPRLLVNVVELVQMDSLRTVKKNDLGCTLLQRTSCHCLLNVQDNSPELQEFRRINKEYQAETQELLSGDRYDRREDFAVVLQPYLRNSFVPYIGEGQADVSFFSVDCFHISERAHAEMAIAVWNNMLEPVGRKQTYSNFAYDRSKIKCPLEAQPFIFTKINSIPSSPGTTTAPTTNTAPTTAPVADTTTFSPVPKCPSNIPVWVPVVAAFASLLVGISVSWLCLSYRQRQKNNELKTIELKKTGL